MKVLAALPGERRNGGMKRVGAGWVGVKHSAMTADESTASDDAENRGTGPGGAAGDLAPARIEALIRLLGDDDEKICAVAWKHLEDAGAASIPQLRLACAESDDARVRSQARSFLREWRRREVLDSWRAFCRSGSLDLESGAFLIARSEYPEAEFSGCRKILDGFASVVGRRIATARSVETVVHSLVQFLYHEQGFRGNEEDYYCPDNSYLNRVLDLRIGIPISLATVYLLVARRLSIPLQGVGMPQHFLMKYRGSGGRDEAFLDPFSGHAKLRAEDCRRYLEFKGVAFELGYLRAVSDRDMLSRMLGNLLRVYHAEGDERRLGRVHVMLKALEEVDS